MNNIRVIKAKYLDDFTEKLILFPITPVQPMHISSVSHVCAKEMHVKRDFDII